MTKHATPIKDVFRIELQSFIDDRGKSTKIYSAEDFDSHGLPTEWKQTLWVANHHRATLRGMHWQAEPHFETKLVHCQRGRIFDVVVDVRPESETFGRWCGFELAGDNSEMLLVPGGLAHGYLTLEKGSEILYQIAGDYKTNMQKSLNWDDPTIKIEWPERPLLISTRDSKAPFWTDLFA